MKSSGVTALIGSGGRRNYLVRWFRSAMKKLGVPGRICVIDSDANAPALADADRGAVIPAFSDPTYGSALSTICNEWGVDFAFSLNDYELELWAGPILPVFEEAKVNVIGVPSWAQAIVSDKLRYACSFAASGIMTPPCIGAKDIVETGTLPDDYGLGYVIKDRFGSGSSGLQYTAVNDVIDQLVSLASSSRADPPAAQPAQHRGRTGMENALDGLQNLVVQTRLPGTEFGVDVVNDFSGRLRGVLARKKLRMRSGETDQAVTSEGDLFSELATGVSTILQHSGTVDVDIIVDGANQWLVDVNPRFGGGYPFSHLGGADVPACYVAWHLGRDIEPLWLSPRPGVYASKFEEVRTVAREYS